jgi:hypothetical protein
MKRILIAMAFSILGTMATPAAELAPRHAKASLLALNAARDARAAREGDDIDSSVPSNRRAVDKAIALSGLLFVAIGTALLASPSGERTTQRD